jgi:hypothetical protein
LFFFVFSLFSGELKTDYMNKKTEIEQFVAHTFSSEGRGKKVKRWIYCSATRSLNQIGNKHDGYNSDSVSRYYMKMRGCG